MGNAEEQDLEEERVKKHADVEDDLVDADYLDDDWE